MIKYYGTITIDEAHHWQKCQYAVPDCVFMAVVLCNATDLQWRGVGIERLKQS